MDRVTLNRRTFAMGTALLGGMAGVTASNPLSVFAATEPDWHDYEDQGMTGHRSYESPNHGIAVSWSRDWELDSEVDPPVAVKDDDFRSDLLSLVHDPEGNVAYFQLGFMDRGKTTAESQMNWTTSDEGLTYFFGDPDGGRVLVSQGSRRAGQVWLQYADGGPVLAVTAIQSGDTLVSCVMSCAAEDAEDAWTASADVLVDDDAVFQIVDWPQVEKALAAEPTTPQAKTDANGDEEIDPAYADAGLTSPTSYESPQYGYIVEWSDPWTMRPPTDTWGAVTSNAKTGDDTLVLDDAVAKTSELLATLLIDTSPQNDLTREIILSAEEYTKVDNTADTVKLTLIDSVKQAHGDTLAVWRQDFQGTTRYRLIAIDIVGDDVQRQTKLDLGGDAPDDDFATLTGAVTMDGDPILLGYTAKEFSDAIASAQ